MEKRRKWESVYAASEIGTGHVLRGNAVRRVKSGFGSKESHGSISS